MISREFEINDFDSVEISNAFKATIVQSDQYRVSVTIDDNLLEHLVVEKRGETLHVGLKRGTSVRNATLEASISLPEMSKVEASGASAVAISDFTVSGDLDVKASGASSVLGRLVATVARLDLSGASRAELAGTANDTSIEASGASSARMEDFTVTNAAVSLSGASSADLNITGKLEKADLSGASTLKFTGNPVVGDVSTSGGSKVESR